MKNIRASLKFVLFGLWCAIMVPPQCAVLAFTKGPVSYVIPWLWHKGVCRIFGLRLIIAGKPHTREQTLFVCNHLSYLDVPLIGSYLRASFVAKKEVEKWPVFGFLSQLQQTAFIDRSRHAALRESNSLAGRLDSGKSLILFPEGTSTGGTDVLPFKSALFSALADRNGLAVQPVSLVLTAVDERTAQQQKDRDIYAWYGDMQLPSHLWAFAQSRGATITLHFHPIRRIDSTTERKELASVCHGDIRSAVQPAVYGMAA